MSKSARVLLVAALGCLLLAAAPARAADHAPTNRWAKLLSEKADSIVTIKFVLKLHLSYHGQSRDIERNQEVRGVVINDSGLILTSNTHFSPPAPNPALEIKANPTDIKVLFGSESTEYPAEIAARDSNLELAFVQIVDLKGRKVKAIDLENGGDVSIGEEVGCITRLARSFDNAPVVGRLFIDGKIDKPRSMWSLAGDFTAVGLPVFDSDGKPVGVVCAQQGSEGVSQGPGSGSGYRPFLLPLSTVSRTVKLAEKRATDLLEKAKKAAAKKAPAKKKSENSDKKEGTKKEEPAKKDKK